MKKVRPATEAAPETPAGRLGEQKLHQIIGYQLAQATVVTDEVFESAVGAPLGLRPIDYTILMLVKENPGGSPGQLSKALAVTRPNISLRVERLEARGLLAREKNVADRRAQHLHTTAAGTALADRATQALLEREGEAFRTLSLAEQLMLAELLHKLACARGGN